MEARLASVPVVSDVSEPAGLDGEALSELLEVTRAVVRRFIVLDDEQLDAVALWVAHTHVFREFDVTPYLAIMSPTMRSGKTNLFNVLERVCYAPELTANISTAALYRTIDAYRPTLLYDERDMQKMSSDHLGILNAGYKQGACVIRSVGGRATRFYVFCPKAFASIGMVLNRTLIDRSIQLHLKRRKSDEAIDKFAIRTVNAATEHLQDRFAEFRDNFIVPDTDPEMPDFLNDREAELWFPLFHIAAQADGWDERVLNACTALTVAARQEEVDDAVLLLADLRTAWGNRGKFFSEDLLKQLTNLEEPHYAGPATQSKKALASALANYQIHPQQIRQGRETKKGYYREQFADAFSRYLDE